MVEQNKPPYYIPTMKEIGGIPYNGYTAVSTFSGAGGSSLGYRLAGFKVLYASEFIPAAAEVYRLNFPGVLVDPRDIREVDPGEILNEIGLKPGELDLLDGSPPCASFSMAGSREDKWGEVVKYSEKKQRVDDLFWEYARILRGLRPRMFVAENVQGLVRGTAVGYFKNILRELKRSGYNVRAKVLSAEWLGVPQSRSRVIFIGTREDLNIEPCFPRPLRFQYVLKDALPNIARVSGRTGNNFSRVDSSLEAPINTLLQSDPSQTRYEVLAPPGDEERSIDIRGTAIGEDYDTIERGSGSDTYKNLKRNDPDKISYALIVQCGQGRSTAGVVHPYEKRKFRISEAKRLMSFPADFRLVGNYAKQWERLTRAVPPIMMYHIARTVRDTLICVDNREPYTGDLEVLLDTIRYGS